MVRPFIVFVILFPSASLCAGVVTYEGNVFPEDAGWARESSFDVERWIENGWFGQHPELGIWGPPPLGEWDFYRRSLAAFAGQPEFFVEWRVESGAPRSDLEVDGTSAALAISGGSAALYHFTITDELIRVSPGFYAPTVYVEIDPGMPHTYRLELDAQCSYAWYIDGQLALTGTPEGPFPVEESYIVWGARYYLAEHTTRWDYIRYGAIPEPATGLLMILGGTALLARRRSRR